MVPPSELVRTIELLQPRGEGITVSGGEPLEQAPVLLAFLRELRAKTCLSVVLFSGFSLDEIRGIPDGPAILDLVDVLIAGRFLRERRAVRGLIGSSNQEIHLMTDRYSRAEVAQAPSAEIMIDAHGNVRLSGMDPPHLPDGDA